ncbi:hypothetical protein L6R29_24340 [Myxococcota bacterium]|nr:hypothetical protein [Myxococcota bacterium]
MSVAVHAANPCASDNLFANTRALSHDTFSTGQLSPHDEKCDGFDPINALYCPWVTSLSNIQNPLLIVTLRCGPSDELRFGSFSGLPIVNEPAGIQRIANVAPFTVSAPPDVFGSLSKLLQPSSCPKLHALLYHTNASDNERPSSAFPLSKAFKPSGI